jgi:hypothetical protein
VLIVLPDGKPLSCYAHSAFGCYGQLHLHEEWINRLFGDRINLMVYDGIFGKFLTRDPVPGAWYDPLLRIRYDFRGSTYNKWAMRGNPGIVEFCWNYTPSSPSHNFFPQLDGSESDENLAYMARKIVDAGLEIAGIELGAFCPNRGEPRDPSAVIKALKIIRGIMPSELKLSVKFAPMQIALVNEIARDLPGLVDIVNVNNVPWEVYAKNRRWKVSPFWYLGGGGAVSGRRIQTLTWPFAEELERLLGDSIPVSWPSCMSWRDVESLLERRRVGEIRLAALTFASVHILNPAGPTAWIRRIWRESSHETGEEQ